MLLSGVAIIITRPERGVLHINSTNNDHLWSLLKGAKSIDLDKQTDGWKIPETSLLKIMAILKNERVMVNSVILEEAVAMEKKLIMSRAQAGSLPISLPTGLSLYPFQIAGIEFIEQTKGRALLADEVGLGKGVQTLAWLNIHPNYRPAVIVCPNVMRLVWEAEANKWLLGKEKIRVLSGTRPTEIADDVVIINYDVIHKWVDHLKPCALILDEPQAIKNRSAVRAMAAVKLSKKAQFVIGLTSTPILNRPAEIWNQLRCIQPDLFPHFSVFSQRYCASGGASNLDELEEGLRAKVMIRRLKRDVFKELPEVTRQTILFDVTQTDRYKQIYRKLIPKITQYKEMRSTMRKDIDDQKDLKGKKQALAKSAEGASTFKMRGVIITEIAKLRQEAARMKFDAGIGWVNDFLAGGQKIVLFGWHIEIQEMLFEQFEESHKAVRIAGGMSPKARDQAIRTFQEDPNCKVVVCSIMAASEGITLTAASTLAAFELPWNPAKVDQMVGRISRIGQKNACNAYMLVAANTIEEKMAQLIDNKQIVTTSAMGDVNVMIEDQAILEAVITDLDQSQSSS